MSALHPLVPLLSFLSGQSATIYLSAFTNARSRWRRAIGMIFLFVVTLSFNKGHETHIRAQWRAVICSFMWMRWLKTFDDLCLTRTTFEEDREFASQFEEKSDSTVNGHTFYQGKDHATHWDKLVWGLSLAWNFRGINTKWAIRGVPTHSQQSDKTFKAFMWHHIKILVVTYLIMDFFAHQPPPEPDMLYGMMKPIQQCTLEEVVTRVMFVLAFYVNVVCLLRMMESATCFTLVGLGMCGVESFQPLFGSFKEAYTVRRFWGNSWHQVLRRSLTNTSDWLICSVLRVPRGSLFARYSKLFLCFLTSGIWHLIADVAGGVPSSLSGSITYFVTTSLAIMAEDAVQEVTSQLVGNKWLTMKRWIGYLWVVLFMIWITPSWAIPFAFVVQPGDTMVPHSVLAHIM